MGYYANGGGCITFAPGIGPDDEKVYEILEPVFGDMQFTPGNSRHAADVCVSYDGKYYEEDVSEALEKLLDVADVTSGCVEFLGEDGEHWRFLYCPGEGWVEQQGRVVYE